VTDELDSPDPLSAAERLALMQAPRPRKLPLAPLARPARRNLPLADDVAPSDKVRPIYCVWEITLACDLACRHCGSRAGRARPDELSTDECLSVVRQLAELDVKEVTLIGGEAYLRPDFTQIVAALAQHGIATSTTTGGRGFTRELAARAKDAGLSSVSVSLDGLSATHDRLRGVDGSFDAALSAMHHCRKVGLRVFNNTQINRLSMPELPCLLDILIEQGSSAWQLMLTVPMGRAVDEPEVMLQPYDLLALFPMLAELKRRADRAGIVIWRGNNLGYFGPYETLFKGWTPAGHHGSCGAGMSTLGIEADGTVKGCPSLGTEAWGAGNLRDAPLSSIWERGGPMRYTRRRSVADLWGHCKSCYYADVCRGGCTWMADMLLGRPGNNPYCHHRALELKARGLRERVEKIEEATGLPFDQGLFRIVEEPLPPC